jgi:hypothetical protein
MVSVSPDVDREGRPETAEATMRECAELGIR